MKLKRVSSKTSRFKEEIGINCSSYLRKKNPTKIVSHGPGLTEGGGKKITTEQNPASSSYKVI